VLISETEEIFQQGDNIDKWVGVDLAALEVRQEVES